MPDPGSITTALILLVIAAASLAVPYATAAAIRNATLAHDLKVKVARLRVEYLRRLRRAEEEAEIVVDPVPDQPEHTPRAAA